MNKSIVNKTCIGDNFARIQACVWAKMLFLFIALWIFSAPGNSQHVAVKSNLLYDAAAIPSLGIETKIAKSTTLDISGTYDPITFSGSRKLKNWMVQPELRRWGCIPFSGPFVGVNAIAGGFNFEKMPFAELKQKRAQGTFYGGGLSFGYHKILSPHWGFESSVSVGAVHISYSRYRCGSCGYKEKSFNQNYVGPTRISFSLVYIIK
jgi:hypothetical protein